MILRGGLPRRRVAAAPRPRRGYSVEAATAEIGPPKRKILARHPVRIVRPLHEPQQRPGHLLLVQYAVVVLVVRVHQTSERRRRGGLQPAPTTSRRRRKTTHAPRDARTEYATHEQNTRHTNRIRDARTECAISKQLIFARLFDVFSASCVVGHGTAARPSGTAPASSSRRAADDERMSTYLRASTRSRPREHRLGSFCRVGSAVA